MDKKYFCVSDFYCLLGLIEDGKIDAVNIAFPDHYGRLIGKKIGAKFFN